MNHAPLRMLSPQETALLLTTVEGKYLRMARQFESRELSPVVLEQMYDVERTIQNAIRFDGRCSVDQALGLAMICHAISSAKVSYGIATKQDEQVLHMVETMDQPLADPTTIPEDRK